MRLTNTRAYLMLILLFAIFLRMIFFVGLNWSDDPGYVFDAHRIIAEKFEPRYANGLRSGMIYPVALFFKLFGVGNASATLYPLLCSLGSIILIFHFGKILFNEKVGLIAAFLLSFYPLDVIYATWIMPDTPLAFFTGLSILLFLLGERTREGFVVGIFKVKKSEIYFFLSGLSVGVGYLLKVSGLIPILFFVAYALFKRQIKVDYVAIVAGLMIIFTLESLYTYSYSGDSLLRYHVVTEYFTGEDVVRTHYLNPDLKFYPRAMFNIDWRNRFNWEYNHYVEYGLFYYFVALSLLYFLVKWERRAFIPILWLLVFFGYLEFGSMSLTEFNPIHKLARHLSVIAMPSILLLAYFLYDNAKQPIRKLFSLLVIVFLVTTSVYYTYHKQAYLKASTYDVKAMYDFLKEKPEKPVYTSGGAIGHIRFYFRFGRNDYMKIVSSETNCDEIDDAYVIVNATIGWIKQYPALRGLPICLRKPPENWELVKTIKGPEIDIFKEFDPKIYYVPP